MKIKGKVKKESAKGKKGHRIKDGGRGTGRSMEE